MLMKSTRILLGYVLLCASVRAQSDRGTLTGTVSDTSGAVVPRAAIVAKESSSGVEYRANTTGTGNFTIASLPAGSYDLTVTASGFKGYLQKGITIQVAQTAGVDVVLQMGSLNESVTVTADAPLLRTENGEQSTTLSRGTLNDLPLNYAASSSIRDPLAFVKLTPGANYEGYLGGIRVNGMPVSTFKITVEGQDMTSPNVSDQDYSTILRPSVEMMQEFTVEGSNFNAEFGQVSGGLFNFTARSGTNQLHGSAYEYLVNEFLNAAQPFTNNGNGQLVRPRNRQNDYGFTVGGPVYIPKLYNGHNKTFFFLNLERYSQHNASLAFITVPTSDMRNGDFSAILTGRTLGTDILGRNILENTIYDPTTARAVGGQMVTDPFTGNIIPKSRLDAAAEKIQSLIPAANQSGLRNNYVTPVPFPKTQTLPAFKIDQVISDKWRVAFYWSYLNLNTFYGNDGLPDPITTRRVAAPYSYTYRVNSDYIITPTLNLHAGIGYVREKNNDTGANTTYDPSQIGMPVAASLGFPEINIPPSNYGGFNNPIGVGYSMGTFFQSHYFPNKATAVSSLTWVHGRHTCKTGAEYKGDSYITQSGKMAMGRYNFSSAETALPYLQTTTVGAGQIGFPYASFLLGLVDSGSVNNWIITQYRRPYVALYVQDTWKVTPKFTLDYGVRWEHTNALRERFYRTSGFSPSTPNPSAGGLRGAMVYEGFGQGRCNCNFLSSYPYAFGPRLGGAYKLTPKTVLRGGWGLIYGIATTLDYLGGNTNVVGMGYNTINFSAPAFGTANTTLDKGFQFTQAQLNAATLAPGIVPVAGSISDFPSPWWDPQGGRPPRINTWNVALQREITPNLMLEAAYVGNRGVWELSGDAGTIELNNINALSLQRIGSFGLNVNNAEDRSLLTSTFASGIPQQRGFQIPYQGFPLGATLAQALRPYPQFGAIYSHFSPLANTWYDSLQAKLTNRFSHGLEMLTSFTWSKSMLRGGDYRGRSAPINDSLNRAVNKDLSPEDQPFVISTAFTYQIPTPGALVKNRFGKGVFGGWQLGGIFSVASGLPIKVPSSTNNLSQLTFQSTFVNRVPGIPPFLVNPNSHLDPNTAVVLNAAAWVDPGLGNWGTAAAYYSDYRWRRLHDEEANLAKTFIIKERVRFQVRAEFFNVFNRTVLNASSSGNITTPQTVPVNGFGRLNPASVGAPRTGQLVARITF
jgi:hypothetical protein